MVLLSSCFLQHLRPNGLRPPFDRECIQRRWWSQPQRREMRLEPSLQLSSKLDQIGVRLSGQQGKDSAQGFVFFGSGF